MKKNQPKSNEGLQKAIDEYEEKKRKEENRFTDYLKQTQQVKNERVEKRTSFLANDGNKDYEK